MKKIFHTHIKKYQFLRPERLYDDFVKYFENDFTNRHSTIYLIVKCKKPRWIDGSFKFLRNFKISAKIEVDGEIHSVVVDMADFWYAMPEMKRYFPDKKTMTCSLMSRSKIMPWRFLPHDLQYKFLSSFVGVEQDGMVLKISCSLMKHSNKEGKSLAEIFLYQAINKYGFPQPKLDIIYIGSSLKGAYSRLQKHEKWGWIQAQKGSDEDILVYFCQIEGDQIQVRHPIISKDSHGLSREDETLITEMALINYFKPDRYNDKHVQRHIRHSSRVKNMLISRGFSQVCVEMLLEGNMAKLGSQFVSKYEGHTIHLDIS